MKTPDNSIETVLSEYSDVFQGMGCLREKITGKKIEIKLEMETDAKPVAQNPQPHALYCITYRNHLKIGWIRG